MPARWIISACVLMSLASSATAFQLPDRDLDDWLKVLKDGETAKKRRAAGFALGRVGAGGATAIPGLADRVQNDTDASVRDMAAQALGEIVLAMKPPSETAWRDAGGILRDRLADEKEARVRRSIVYALGAFGQVARPAMASIRDALADKTPTVRQNAAWAMGRIGAGASDLSRCLKDADTLVRRDAAQALGHLARTSGRKAASAAGRALIRMAVEEKDPVVRKAALASVASVVGPEHAEDCKDLHPLLEDKDGDTARAAAFALAAAGGEHLKKAMSVLEAALSDADPAVQALAAAGLANIGADAAPASAGLARCLAKSDDPIVRRNCAIALGKLGAAIEDEGVRALGGALKIRNAGARQKDEDEVRHMAAEALTHIQFPRNKEALPAILNAILGDPRQHIRLRLVEALFGISNLQADGVARALEKVLNEKGMESQAVRYNVARLMANKMRADAPDRAVEVLLEMIVDPNIKVFIRTDAKVDGGSTEGMKGTTSTDSVTEGSARFMAAEALGRMGTKSKGNKLVMDALKKAANDPDVNLSKKAKQALEDLDR